MIIREYNNSYQSFDYTENNNIPMYGYRIYNDMTDENTFIISRDKNLVGTYSYQLVNLYRNYNEETIDSDLDKFYNQAAITSSKVIITDPEYWTEHKDDFTDHWILTDSDGTTYEITIIGYWSIRF